MDRVVECAAAHVAKLFSGEMSEKDLLRLKEWLAEDVNHRIEYEAVLKAWDLAEDFSHDAEVDLDDNETPAVAKHSTILFKIAVGFGSVFLAFSAYFFTQTGVKSNAHPETEYVTVVGEQRTIRLEDNSTVTLNTGTKIQVDFSKNKRHLTLAYGEAFFDIEKDPSRPFVIDFGERKIVVLGTQFNVHLAASISTVSVIEGLVSVGDSTAAGLQQPVKALTSRKVDASEDDGQVLLEAGKTATFSTRDTDIAAVVESDLEEFQDWRLGQIRFDRESLIKVVAELNRYSNRKVLIEDSTIVELEVSGVFQLDKFDQFLQGIDAVLPVEVVKFSDRYVIVSSGQQAGVIEDFSSSTL